MAWSSDIVNKLSNYKDLETVEDEKHERELLENSKTLLKRAKELRLRNFKSDIEVATEQLNKINETKLASIKNEGEEFVMTKNGIKPINPEEDKCDVRTNRID
jgi:hypothetical protein